MMGYVHERTLASVLREIKNSVHPLRGSVKKYSIIQPFQR